MYATKKQIEEMDYFTKENLINFVIGEKWTVEEVATHFGALSQEVECESANADLLKCSVCGIWDYYYFMDEENYGNLVCEECI